MAEKEQKTQTVPGPATKASENHAPGGDGASVPAKDVKGGTDAPQDLNQIREILFGQQRDEFQERFERLEEQLRDDAAKLQKDFEARLESMEKQFTEEARRITERLEDEAEKRSKALNQLTESLKEKEGALSTILESETARVEKALKDRSEALQADFEKRAARLTSEKASRKDLAAFFSDIAERLSEDA